MAKILKHQNLNLVNENSPTVPIPPPTHYDTFFFNSKSTHNILPKVSEFYLSKTKICLFVQMYNNIMLNLLVIKKSLTIIDEHKLTTLLCLLITIRKDVTGKTIAHTSTSQ